MCWRWLPVTLPQVEAACIIQDFWRTHGGKSAERTAQQTQYNVWSAQALRGLPENFARMAVTHFQALWRGHRDRKTLKHLHMAAKVVQSIYRGNIKRALLAASNRAKRRVSERVSERQTGEAGAGVHS